MRHDFNFTSPLPDLRRYVFSWNDETGELSGPSAEDIRNWVDVAIDDGVIHCSEINGDIPVTKPLRVKTEFCALIGLANLPTDLKPFFPTRDYPGFVSFDDTDADANVIKPDIEVLF